MLWQAVINNRAAASSLGTDNTGGRTATGSEPVAPSSGDESRGGARTPLESALGSAGLEGGILAPAALAAGGGAGSGPGREGGGSPQPPQLATVELLLGRDVVVDLDDPNTYLGHGE